MRCCQNDVEKRSATRTALAQTREVHVLQPFKKKKKKSHKHNLKLRRTLSSL
jgi:hypothetical protein